jgi:hypothetical protein
MAVIGDALTFGIAADQGGGSPVLVLQKLTVNQKTDQKEARDRNGVVQAVSFYNKTQEISLEGLGAYTGAAIGAALSLSGITLVGTSAYVQEINVEHGNEEFLKTSVKAVCWEGI